MTTNPIAYSFEPDTRIWDRSYKQRIDNLVKLNCVVFDGINLPPVEHDCVIWQYGLNTLEKPVAIDTVLKLQDMFKAGVIETYNGFIAGSVSNWLTSDFTDLGLSWRFFGPGRNTVNYIIGYWQR